MFEHKYKISTDLGDKDHILYLKTRLSSNDTFYSLGKIEDEFFTITSNKPIVEFPSLNTLEFISTLKHDEYEDNLNKVEVYNDNIQIITIRDVKAYNIDYINTRYNDIYNNILYFITESLDPDIIIVNPVYDDTVYYVSKTYFKKINFNIKFKLKRRHPYIQQDIDKYFNHIHNYMIFCPFIYHATFRNIKLYRLKQRFFHNNHTYYNIEFYQLYKLIKLYYYFKKTSNHGHVYDKDIMYNEIESFLIFINKLKK